MIFFLFLIFFTVHSEKESYIHGTFGTLICNSKHVHFHTGRYQNATLQWTGK